MKTVTLTESQLEGIIRTAFSKGENWAITYQGWFVPIKEQTEKKVRACIDNCMEKVEEPDGN